MEHSFLGMLHKSWLFYLKLQAGHPSSFPAFHQSGALFPDTFLLAATPSAKVHTPLHLVASPTPKTSQAFRLASSVRSPNEATMLWLYKESISYSYKIWFRKNFWSNERSPPQSEGNSTRDLSLPPNIEKLKDCRGFIHREFNSGLKVSIQKNLQAGCARLLPITHGRVFKLSFIIQLTRSTNLLQACCLGSCQTMVEGKARQKLHAMKNLWPLKVRPAANPSWSKGARWFDTSRAMKSSKPTVWISEVDENGHMYEELSRHVIV